MEVREGGRDGGIKDKNGNLILFYDIYILKLEKKCYLGIVL